MNLLEWSAAVLGLLGVFFGMRQKLWVWPLWIGSSALYVYLYVKLALWGQAGLMLIFICMSLWGLVQWRRQRDKGAEQPTWHGLSAWRPSLLMAIAAWLVLGVILGRAQSPHAWLDAWVTMTSLLAMWLMARRKLDCWLIWALANSSAVVLFVSQALWPTSLLYALQLGLSIMGFFRWRALLRQQQPL